MLRPFSVRPNIVEALFQDVGADGGWQSAVRVRAGRVDPREEALQEGALAGANSASQRQKVSWAGQRAVGRA